MCVGGGGGLSDILVFRLWGGGGELHFSVSFIVGGTKLHFSVSFIVGKLNQTVSVSHNCTGKKKRSGSNRDPCEFSNLSSYRRAPATHNATSRY